MSTLALVIGGLAVGASIIVDHPVGLVTWAVAAAHEIPQELGNFEVLHSLAFFIGFAILLAVAG